MAVVHQLEITAAEATAALSTSDAIDNKTKQVIDMFKEKFGEVTPDNQRDFSVASRVMVYYSIADPNSLRGRLASVLPGDTVVLGGDAPAWYYTLAIQQVLKFNPGLILVQLNPTQAVTVFSASLTDINTHVADSKWMTKEEMDAEAEKFKQEAADATPPTQDEVEQKLKEAALAGGITKAE